MPLEAELQWMTSTINREAERRGFLAGIEAAAKKVAAMMKLIRDGAPIGTDLVADTLYEALAEVEIDIRSIEPPKGGDHGS